MANIYFVSKTGADGNNGLSTGAAWATFAHAISVAVGGDTVNIGAGTYTVASIDFTRVATSGAPVTFIGAGTIANFAGYQTIVNAQVIISGAWNIVKNISFQWSLSTNGQQQLAAVDFTGSNNLFDHCDISNLKLSNQSQSFALRMNGTNNTCDGCAVHDFLGIDVIQTFGNHATFKNGYIYSIALGDFNLNHVDLFQTFGFTGSQCLFFAFYNNYCTMDVNVGLGIVGPDLANTETDGFDANVHDMYVFNNIFVKMDNSFFSGVPFTHFFNNIIMDKQGGGSGSAAVYFYQDNDINNYTGTGDNGPSGFNRFSANSTCHNNCFINNFASGSQDLSTNGKINGVGWNGAGLVIDRNFFSNSENATAAGSQQGTNSVGGNGVVPFISPLGSGLARNFHLVAGSVLIGKGANLTSFFTNLGLTPFDKDGVARPTSGAWDIGPYQFSSGGGGTTTNATESIHPRATATYRSNVTHDAKLII